MKRIFSLNTRWISTKILSDRIGKERIIILKKFTEAAILCVLLFTMTGCVQKESADEVVNQKYQFNIENMDGTETVIHSWIDDEGKEHVFLPSYCDKEEVLLMNGFNELEDVEFHESENVAALFINTESQSMDAIHSDKEYREAAEAILFTADGKIDYQTAECSLKGRGNSTWDLFEKKPYQLKLEEKGNLLNMGEGKKWILLANAFDETSLRNKFVYDLARENDWCYAPECEYVDLYLNGEYRGLYLLTERVEFGEDRLNVEADEKYMCNIEYVERWDSLDNAFLTDSGRAVEIREPDEPTEQDYTRIQELVNEMETMILNPENGETLGEKIDIESWVYKYLLDEIMENGDADIASSYFYYADGKFYAGPLWDYDNTLGVSTRNQNPYTFLARSGYKYKQHGTPYYDSLYSQKEFYDKIAELYCEEVLPALEEEIQTGLFDKENEIKSAVHMNRIRWENAFKEQNSEIRNVTDICEYLEKRIEFLNSAWIEGEEYCTVQFEPYVIDMYATEETYAGSYAVKKGERFCDLSVPKITEEDVIWVNCENGEVFDSEQIITEDITLIPAREDDSQG